MNVNREVKVLVDDVVFQITSEPHMLFRVLKGLEIQGVVAKVSYFDKEINDWTCFQGLREAVS